MSAASRGRSASDRGENAAGIRGAAQAGLPGPSDAVEDGGDAVGDHLAVAVDQRDVEGNLHPRTRHHLPLESVTVNIDDARQHQQPAGVEGGLRRPVGTDLGDNTVRCADVDGRVLKRALVQNPSANNSKIHQVPHRMTARRGRSAICGSYLFRNASAESFRKSAAPGAAAHGANPTMSAPPFAARWRPETAA